MSFILRAAVVIGALSYFAAQRDGGARPDVELTDLAERQGATIAGLASALPAEIGAAAGRTASAEWVKRLSTGAPSRDTLLAVDRRPEWRGSDVR